MPFQSGDICPAGGADIRGGHASFVRPSRDRAKALGLAVPDKLLALANDVVE